MCMEQAPICPQEANSYCQTHRQRRAALSLDIFLPTPFLISVVPCVLKNILTQLLLPVPSLTMRTFFLKQALTLVFKKWKCQHLSSFRAAPKIIFYFTLGENKKVSLSKLSPEVWKIFWQLKTKGGKATEVQAYIRCPCPPTLNDVVSTFKTQVKVKLTRRKIRAKPT